MMVAQLKLDKERHDDLGAGVEVIQAKLLVRELEQRWSESGLLK